MASQPEVDHSTSLEGWRRGSQGVGVQDQNAVQRQQTTPGGLGGQQVLYEGHVPAQGSRQLEREHHQRRQGTKAVQNPEGGHSTQDTRDSRHSREELGITILPTCVWTCHDGPLFKGQVQVGGL